jgi:hypothetical protein
MLGLALILRIMAILVGVYQEIAITQSKFAMKI